MIKTLQTMALGFAFAVAPAALARAQDKPPAPAAVIVPTIRHALEAATPLRVQVVVARYQGEKKLSSMPYTLTMNAGGKSNIRMGATIPVTTGPMPSLAKDAPVGGGPFQYKDVGTNIDCSSFEVEGGRYSIALTIDDSSVYPDDQAGAAKGIPSFRSFRAVNTMVLKNGETGQFTAATDKITGETMRVDVTLTVSK
jgi:hypothetical protein